MTKCKWKVKRIHTCKSVFPDIIFSVMLTKLKFIWFCLNVYENISLERFKEWTGCPVLRLPFKQSFSPFLCSWWSVRFTTGSGIAHSWQQKLLWAVGSFEFASSGEFHAMCWLSWWRKGCMQGKKKDHVGSRKWFIPNLLLGNVIEGHVLVKDRCFFFWGCTLQRKPRLNNPHMGRAKCWALSLCGVYRQHGTQYWWFSLSPLFTISNWPMQVCDWKKSNSNTLFSKVQTRLWGN